MAEPDRRDLTYRSLEEVEAGLDELEGREIETLGRWSFFQILEHLAAGAEWACGEHGFAPPEGGLEASPEFKRKMFDRMLRSGKMKAGFPNPAAPDEYAEGDAAAEMRRLRAALTRLKTYSGPFPEHLVFGVLDADEWRVWCAMHCAHHLSFARIKN